MQASPKKQEPVAVILDCELGRSVESALALALLHGLAKRAEPEAQFGAVSLTRSNLQGAAFCDAVGRFYSKIWLRKYPERFRRYRGFSVGVDSTDAPGESAALAAVLGKQTADGKAVYPHEVREIFDTADPLAMIRNALTAEADGGCAVVLAGSAKNLAGLLDLNGAPELIAAKVRVLAVAMDEESVRADAPAARKVFAEWPSPIVAVRPTGVRFPPDTAFTWTENHPVADVLRASGADAGTASLAAALYAVRPETEAFAMSEPGRIRVDGERLVLEADPSGRHRMLGADAGTLAELYRDLVTAEPAAREPSGFIKRIIEEEKEEQEKQDEQS